MQTLPSDPQPARSSGLTLAPFRAVRYDPDRVRGLADVTSPPYDVIGPGIVERLLAAEPHNIVRVILPGAGSPQPPRGAEASQLAAGLLRDWLGAGVLRPDPRPALYVYEQARPMTGGQDWDVVQRGLIGALRLVPPGSPSVLPHEDVMPGPVEGRRELMATTQANLEPIFLLYNEDVADAHCGPGTATGLVDEVAAARPPLACAVTGDGTRHRLWALTDPAEQAAVAADLADRTALIADGHHRYAAYLKLQEQERAAGHGEGPWDYGLAFLVDAAAYPPQIGAIHRVLPGLAPARAAEMAKGAMCVRTLDGDLDGAVAALAGAGRHGPAFLVTNGDEQYLLTEPAPERLAEVMPAGHSARWRGLDASVLRELLIGSVWGLADAEPDVLVIHGEPAAAVQAAQAAGGTAVVGNPVRAADVRAVAEHGERMPRKSTSFGPKPRTGLVLRQWADER
ncbi:MAG TPA: DUF1015 domain-containing protein [Streptosporangiaceae bacterium]|nr:DUF1015 domain-containing protein [Streptosporangiaceae bacterium]